MRQHVTVVPSDHLIFVDGFALCFDFSAPKNMHALQWHEGSGHIEYNSLEARADRIRSERNLRLDATTWLVERHKEQTTGAIKTSITEKDYNALLAYRQALRDLPQQQGFPWHGDVNALDVPWPLMPTFLQAPQLPNPDDKEIVVPKL